jgi:hypothetical protein
MGNTFTQNAVEIMCKSSENTGAFRIASRRARRVLRRAVDLLLQPWLLLLLLLDE